ncbi:MAG: hypothetical protein CMJ83_04835 [Planctomycetes bacterium]|nr:hypothetical protein [Planctomycetota bacterium]
MSRCAILLVLVNLVLVSPGQTGRPSRCSVCDRVKMVTCVTCNGRGKVKIDCSRCSGLGKTDCLRCGMPKLTGDPEADAVVKAARKRIREALRTTIGKKKLRRKTPVDGKTICPSSVCYGGAILWESGHRASCKLCAASGLTKCAACRAGKITCRACAGDRRLEIPCWTCGGGKTLPCPGCVIKEPANRCQLCKGKAYLKCWLCGRGGHNEVGCGSCSATGRAVCQSCSGLARQACQKCAGCGRVRYKTVGGGGRSSSAGTKSCNECSGRGFDKCTQCVKGTTSCDTCEGRKRVRKDCTYAGKTACGCTILGPWAPLEVFGDILLAAGRKNRARKFMIAAAQAAAKPLSVSEVPPLLAKRREKERRRAIPRLRLKLKKTAR